MHVDSKSIESEAKYTPPTPTRLNCRVESCWRCVFGIKWFWKEKLNDDYWMISFWLVVTVGLCNLFMAGPVLYEYVTPCDDADDDDDDDDADGGGGGGGG